MQWCHMQLSGCMSLKLFQFCSLGRYQCQFVQLPVQNRTAKQLNAWIRITNSTATWQKLAIIIIQVMDGGPWLNALVVRSFLSLPPTSKTQRRGLQH